MSKNPDRYARQIQFTPIGQSGQDRITSATVLVVGCGALGSVLANTLARSGVGYLRIVDRDFLELNNLQRQVLYDEADVAGNFPKAIAAANRLREVNSTITVEPVVADVNSTNIETFLAGVDCVVDGTDNFEVRYLINDACLRHQIPWVYGGCIGAEGQTMTIVPGTTACLRCLLPEPPPPGSAPTCDTAGILATIVQVIASMQANEAIKVISGNMGAINRTLTIFELWENRIRQIGLESLASVDCPACKHQQYDWLEGDRASSVAVLCGRNAVQLTFPDRAALDLEILATKLSSHGSIQRNPYLVRCDTGRHLLTVFPDGRAVIGGTDDPAEAKTVYAKLIGN